MIDLWVADLDLSPADLEPLLTALSPDERERAARFAVPLPRRRFQAGRAILRHLLGASLGIAPAEVRLIAGPEGKPALSAGELQFNLSHSGDLLLVALAAGLPVGVDLEQVRAVTAQEAIAARYLTAGERSDLTGWAPDEQEQAADSPFLRFWTAKEAVVKAIGTGISRSWSEVELRWAPPDRFTVLRAGPSPGPTAGPNPGPTPGPSTWPLPAPGPAPWSVRSFTPAPGFVAALAAPRPEISLRIARWRPPSHQEVQP